MIATDEYMKGGRAKAERDLGTVNRGYRGSSEAAVPAVGTVEQRQSVAAAVPLGPGWAEELGRKLAGQQDINPKTGKPWRFTPEHREAISKALRLKHIERKANELRAKRADAHRQWVPESKP